MVIVSLDIVGEEVLPVMTNSIRALDTQMTAAEKKKMITATARSKGGLKDTKTLHRTTRLTTDISALGAAAVKVQTTDTIETAILERQGEILGSVNVKGKRASQVIKEYTAARNHIVLQFPSVAPGKGVVITPKAGDLSVTRDKKTNAWNIKLKKSTIDKQRKLLTAQLDKDMDMFVEKQTTKIKQGKLPTGVEFAVAARYGLSVDKVHIAPTGFAGTDLTKEVHAEMIRRMHKSGKTYSSNARGRQATKLINRTGKYVKAVKNVKIKSDTVITYQFMSGDVGTMASYNIHERQPAGTLTEIKATGTRQTKSGKTVAKVLAFTNKKTGEKVFTRKVTIRSRPVIREAVRAVAFRKFNKEFKIVRGN